MPTPYDPLEDALNGQQPQPPQVPGIVNTAMQNTAPAATPAPAPAPRSPAIVGAQSSQLGTPQSWDVNADQTVEGRINRIINSESPFMQQARTRATEEANRRGLANTSMAITAGESAAYDAALPIAQADAATYAKAAGYNADQFNQFSTKNTDYENQFGLQDKTVQGEKDLALINRDTQVQLSNLDAANRLTAQQFAQQNDRILQTNAQAAQVFQTAMSAVNNIQNNNEMDGNTKAQAIAQVWRDTQSQLRVLGAVAGLDLVSQLNFANYPGFDANGSFIGFPGGSWVAGTRAGSGVGLVCPRPRPTRFHRLLSRGGRRCVRMTIAFSRELLCEVVQEVQPLLQQHYEELCLHRDVIKLDPMWQEYALLERMERFVVFTAREDGALVGYNAFFLNRHMHYGGFTVAQNDVLFLHPAQRRGTTALKFIDWAEQALWALGAGKLSYHIKFALDWRPILHRRGYADEEVMVAKMRPHGI